MAKYTGADGDHPLVDFNVKSGPMRSPASEQGAVSPDNYMGSGSDPDESRHAASGGLGPTDAMHRSYEEGEDVDGKEED